MVLRDTRDVWLESSRAPEGNEAYLRVEGARTENICVAANDLRASRKAIDLGPGVRADSIFQTARLQPLQGE